MTIDERILPIGVLERQFKDSLTEGERFLIEYLSKHLLKKENKEDDWIICAKPQLHWGGNETPDVVIANNNKGIIIFEVKDWDLTKYTQRRIRSKVGIYTGKSNNKYPIERVAEYRDIMIEGIPEIGHEIFIEDTSKQKLIKSVLYFHKCSTKLVQKKLSSNIFKEGNVLAIGSDVLDNDFSLKKHLPILNEDKKVKLDNWIDKFKNWVMPPIHEIDDGEITESNLTKKQKKYVQIKSQTTQKLSGVAGSGKTRVLALRAANLASQNKSVLVVCFNITLVNYLVKQIKKAKFRFRPKNIRVIHFDGFRKTYRNLREIPWNKDDKLHTEELITDKKNNPNNTRNYDAILIDEGQDFEQHWFEFLKLFLTPHREILYTVDEKQNIYEKKLNWVGRGRWAVLEEGCRIPQQHLALINQFSETFLKQFTKDTENPKIVEPEEKQLFLFPTESKFYYKQCVNFDATENAVFNHIELFKKQKHHLSDIAVLVENHKEGAYLKSFLKKKYDNDFEITDIFSEDEKISRQKKLLFGYSASRSKKKLLMCTINSFKGWEAKDLIILIPNKSEKYISKLNYLIYTGITRVKDNLVVINNNPYYEKFFQKFKNENSKYFN